METVVSRLADYTKRAPDAAILYDETHSGGVTYARLDDRLCGLLLLTTGTAIPRKAGIQAEHRMVADPRRGALEMPREISVSMRTGTCQTAAPRKESRSRA